MVGLKEGEQQQLAIVALSSCHLLVHQSQSPYYPIDNIIQPTEAPGLVDTFICHCTDCRKITASMFASNFIIADSHLTHVRGREKLSTFRQSKTIESGKAMTNYFCSVCGSLMYRVGEAFPGSSILRIGTVDDFQLHESKLKPRVEQYAKDRVGWLRDADGVKQIQGSAYTPRQRREAL